MTGGAVLMAVAGLTLLVVAADRFVVAAARLSRVWGIAPILIGALIVGMGTSAPEFLVSLLASIEGDRDLALGNPVGSNVANVTLVLGGTALIAPIMGSHRLLRREGLLMLAGVVALAAVLYDFEAGRLEGGALCIGMVVAAILLVRWSRQDAESSTAVPAEVGMLLGEGPVAWKREVVVGVVALGATLLGAELLVRGGISLAESLGVGSAFIGMTLVAVGTSLPELATAIAGARRGETEIVLGNVLGSNLFNALAVSGIGPLVNPGTIHPSFRVATLAMVASAVLAGVLAATGKKLVRWEGAVLLLGYVGFVWLTYT